jgi:hypothetical protein
VEFLQDGQNPRQVIGTHLCAAISAAINLVRDSKSQSIDMKEIIKLFDKVKMSILCDTLVDKNLKRPTPDKIFREVERDGISVLIPVSDATGIVLQHSLSKKPSLNELEELLKKKVGRWSFKNSIKTDKK